MDYQTTATVAKRLRAHPNTIRDWTRRYASFLSDYANNPKRKYTEDDFLILATIADYREKGISFEAITDALDDGKRIDIDAIPLEATPEEEKARDNVEIVAIPRDTLLVTETKYKEQISQFERDLKRLSSERDNLIDKLTVAEGKSKDLEVKLKDVEGDLKATEAQLKIIKQERFSSLFWLPVLIAFVLATIAITSAIFVFAR